MKGKDPSNDKRRFYIVLVILFAAGIAILSSLRAAGRAQSSYVDSSMAPIANQGHVMGSDSALVEIVEYADFECPACAIFANLTEPDVREKLVNSGQVRYRFIDFPLDMHRNTWAAHLSAWCAGDQGRFWEMHDAIFMNQDRWSSEATKNPEGVLTPLARQVGVNMEQYEGCMESRKFIPQIRANYDESVRRGIQSTPSFQMGSQVHLGALSYDDIKRLVDKELAAKRAAAPATKR